MSRVISMRLQDEQVARLQRVARRMGRTPSETSAILVDEALRAAEFGGIEFRDSPVGRQAYIHGTSLAAWEVISVAREYGMDVQRTAAHLRWPAYRVRAALNYACAFPAEIENAVQDNESYTWNVVSSMLPQAERFPQYPG